MGESCSADLTQALRKRPGIPKSAWASVEHGLWYARSAEFLQQPWVAALRWLRMVGDTVFIAGTAAFAYFMLGLWTGRSY